MTEPTPRPLTRRELRLAESTTAQPRTTRPTPTALVAARPAPVRAATSTVPAPAPAPASASAASRPRRRDLREAERAACARPFSLHLAPALPRTASRRPGPRTRAARGPVATNAAKGLVAVALSGAMVVTALSYLDAGTFDSPGYASAAQVNAAERAAALEARLTQERADRASTARLTTQASAFAAARRVEALAVAEQALLTADTAVVTSAPVLGADGVSALDQAVANLAALVEVTPAPPPVVVEDDGLLEEMVGADRVSAASRTSDLRAPVPDATSTETDAATPAPTDTTTGSATAGAATEAPAPPVASARGTAARTPQVPAAPPTTTDLLALDAEVLDMEVTADLLAAAAQVQALSVQVQQSAAETVAAQEAARVAAEAAAAELQRKVDAVKAAENGNVPEELMCAVDFDADVLLRCDAAAALERLNVAFRAKFGTDLQVSSSYRSYTAQIATKAARGSLAAAPGTSNHGRGIAADFSGFGGLGEFDSPRYRWMKANSEAYGWVHPRIMEPGGPGPLEPWHWEFGTE